MQSHIAVVYKYYDSLWSWVQLLQNGDFLHQSLKLRRMAERNKQI